MHTPSVIRRYLLLALVTLGGALLFCLAGAGAAPASAAEKVSVDLYCWDPHAGPNGPMCGAGDPDVRAMQPLSFDVDVDWCTSSFIVICNGSTGMGSQVVIQFDKDDGGATVDHQSAPINVSSSSGHHGENPNADWTTTYTAAGVYRPKVRICAYPALSPCSGWDNNTDGALINYDLDVKPGPDATMRHFSPCEAETGIGCADTGLPDGSTADTFTLKADYNDPDGVAVARLEWDFEGNGTVDASTNVSGTAGSNVTTTHNYAAGTYSPQVRAVGVDGATGSWDRDNNFGCLGDCELDVYAVKVKADMGCWDPHDQQVICGAGGYDVRVSRPIQLNADVSSCLNACVGNWFTPTNYFSFDVHWKLNGPAGTTEIVQDVGGDADRSVTFPTGYSALGAYRPEVRLCDDAATSTNCTGWDRYDVALVEYDLDVYGPETTMGHFSPCEAETPGGCADTGLPDGSTADTFTLKADFDDPSGSAVARLEWDFEGDGSVDASTNVSGSSGSNVTTTHNYAAGTYSPQVRAVGTDGAAGPWDRDNGFGCLGDCELDVAAAQIKADMGCWDPHDQVVICGAGTHDVRVGQPIQLNADLDACTSLCVGNWFTPSNPFDFDVQWRLGGPGATTEIVQQISGSGDRSVTFPAGYSASGEYRPEVRLCDDAATSTNCTGWDRYDVALVEYDLDVYGPETSMKHWSPCEAETAIGCADTGLPDGTAADTFTLKGDFSDPDGVAVDRLEWDFEGDGTPDASTGVGGTSGSGITTTHRYAAGTYTPQVRAVGVDGAVGRWDHNNEFGCVLDCELDVYTVKIRADMGCWDPHDWVVICGTGLPGRDVRVGSQLTLNADIATCAVLCLDTFGHHWTEIGDIDNYEIQWRLNGPSAGPTEVTQVIAGTASRSLVVANGYDTVGAYQPEVRVCDIGGVNCSDWSKHDDGGLISYDLDVYGPEADMKHWDPCEIVYPACIDTGISPDGGTGVTFTFHADFSDPDAGRQIVSAQWDYDGDGGTDATTAVNPPSNSGSASAQHYFGFARKDMHPRVRFVADDGAVGAWDTNNSIGCVLDCELDVFDPYSACEGPLNGDADLDGVPCRYDPDGDTRRFRNQLNWVRQAAAPGPILTNWEPDAAIVAGLNMSRKQFWGTTLYTGQLNFINADIVLDSGITVDVQETILTLWATVGIGSSEDTAYFKGVAFCTGKKPSSFFGLAFGFCTYGAAIDDDTQTLELEDEVYIHTYIPGYGPVDYYGFTLPLISPEIEVSVNP